MKTYRYSDILSVVVVVVVADNTSVLHNIVGVVVRYSLLGFVEWVPSHHVTFLVMGLVEHNLFHYQSIVK